MSEFDTYADDYEAALDRGIAVSGERKEFFAEQRVQWLRECLDAMQFAPNRVLDYGCGTGTSIPLLLEVLRAGEAIGIDVSQKSLDVARHAHGDLPVRFQTPEDYVADASVDLVFCNGVFHHIPLPDRPAVIESIAAYLRPGGVFALWENNPWSLAARYVMSRIPFDRDAVMVWPTGARALVQRGGFDVVRTDYRFIFPRALRMLRPVEAACGRLALGAQYQILSIKRERGSS